MVILFRSYLMKGLTAAAFPLLTELFQHKQTDKKKPERQNEQLLFLLSPLSGFLWCVHQREQKSATWSVHKGKVSTYLVSLPLTSLAWRNTPVMSNFTTCDSRRLTMVIKIWICYVRLCTMIELYNFYFMHEIQ